MNTDDMGRGVSLLCNHPPSKHYSVFYWVSFIMFLAWHLSWDALADASFPSDKAVSSGDMIKETRDSRYNAPINRTVSLIGIII